MRTSFAQLAVGDACFWVANAEPGTGRFSAAAIGGGTSGTLVVAGDPDTVFSAAFAAGATVTSPAADRARLAARPDDRPVRAPLGDRHIPWTLATLNNTARRHQSRAERTF